MFDWLDSGGPVKRLMLRRLGDGKTWDEVAFIRPAEGGSGWSVTILGVAAGGWDGLSEYSMKREAQLMVARRLIQIADELLK